jgi:glycosyltransferase involved in cell wall biosynthesis
LKPSLAIVETHPVQYHAPVWRHAATKLGLPLKVIYGGDFSVRGYRDREFGASFHWEADLLTGYVSEVLQPTSPDYESVTAAGLASALDAMQPAAVLALGYHHSLDRAALRWARQHRVPLIFRGETSDAPHSNRVWWRALLRDRMLRRLYRGCDYCLYLGERSKAHYQRLGVSSERLILSPYCVDSSAFEAGEEARENHRRSSRQSAGIAEDAVVIMFAGKLSARKGVDLLPLALRSLPSALAEHVHLLFVGAGERREALEMACADHPSMRCHFTGFVNQSGLSAWYHAADILVLPSLELETWGLVVNDALHHGVPAVVSDAVGCAPDLVIPGQTGEISRVGDAVSLAAALERCVGWSQTTTGLVRQRCRDHVAQFSIAKAADGLNQVWHKIITQQSF